MPPTVSTSAASSRSRKSPVAAASILTGLFLAAALPLILSGYALRTAPDAHGHAVAGRIIVDQTRFHLPAIRGFIRQWPHPGFSDYPSATTPGYHLAIAAVSRCVGESPRTLQLIGMGFTVLLLVTLAVWTANRRAAGAAIALCLPVLCSQYIFAAGVWLLPDNAGWLGVVLVMGIAMSRRVQVGTTVVAGIAFLALVLVRQVHVWAIAPLLAWAWIGGASPPAAGCKDVPASCLKRVGLMLLAAIPAIAVLAGFCHLWHGLIPPSQQTLVGGGNSAAPVAVLATAGLLGLFFIGFLPSRFLAPRPLAKAALGAAAAAIFAIVVPTTWNQAAGRRSGIWNIAQHTPILFERTSLALVALASLGGAIVVLWLMALPHRPRWIWAVAAIAFMLAQAANHNAFYRYYEPAVLLAAAMTCPLMTPAPRRWAWAGPVVLAGGLVVMTILAIR